MKKKIICSVYHKLTGQFPVLHTAQHDELIQLLLQLKVTFTFKIYLRLIIEKKKSTEKFSMGNIFMTIYNYIKYFFFPK